MVREDEVRNIAYALWAQDGYNHTAAVKHWLQAEKIWERNQKVINAPGPSPGKQNQKPQALTE